MENRQRFNESLTREKLLSKNFLWRILLVAAVTSPLCQCAGRSPKEGPPPAQPAAVKGCGTVADCAQQAVEAAFAAQRAADGTDAKIKDLTDRVAKMQDQVDKLQARLGAIGTDSNETRKTYTRGGYFVTYNKDGEKQGCDTGQFVSAIDINWANVGHGDSAMADIGVYCRKLVP